MSDCCYNVGVEILYDLYNPLLRKIEVLKLEKRLDEHLMYMRDALPEYSTIPFDMEAIPHPPGSPVPVNTIQVCSSSFKLFNFVQIYVSLQIRCVRLQVELKPGKWSRRWNLKKFDLKGVLPCEHLLNDYMREKSKRTIHYWWEEYDVMLEYREHIPIEVSNSYCPCFKEFLLLILNEASAA